MYNAEVSGSLNFLIVELAASSHQYGIRFAGWQYSEIRERESDSKCSSTRRSVARLARRVSEFRVPRIPIRTAGIFTPRTAGCDQRPHGQAGYSTAKDSEFVGSLELEADGVTHQTERYDGSTSTQRSQRIAKKLAQIEWPLAINFWPR